MINGLNIIEELIKEENFEILSEILQHFGWTQKFFKEDEKKYKSILNMINNLNLLKDQYSKYTELKKILNLDK